MLDKIFNYKKIGCTKKELIIFYVIVGVLLVLLICGIVFTTIGNPNYALYVGEWKAAYQAGLTVTNPTDISFFIYGIFSLVISVLFIFMALLYGNSLFNKKLKAKENE